MARPSAMRYGRHTGGHPLFTVELLRGLRERGDIVRDATGAWCEEPVAGLGVAAGAAGDRHRRAPGAPAERLAAAAGGGQRVRRGVHRRGGGAGGRGWTAVRAARPERPLAPPAPAGAAGRHRARRAAASLSRYRFRHYLFQSYLYRGLDAGERAHLHERMGAGAGANCTRDSLDVSRRSWRATSARPGATKRPCTI